MGRVSFSGNGVSVDKNSITFCKISYTEPKKDTRQDRTTNSTKQTQQEKERPAVRMLKDQKSLPQTHPKSNYNKHSRVEAKT